jgi:hypothetical protein
MTRHADAALVRAGVVLGMLAVGLATGLAVVLLHDRVLGLLLGLAATAATVVAAPGGARRLGFVAGWAAIVVYAAVPRPEGDYLLAADLEGYLLLAAVPVLVVVALVTFPRPRP